MSDHCCGSNSHLKEQPAPVAAGRVDSCCVGGVPVFDGVDPRYRFVLWTVIGINGVIPAAQPGDTYLMRVAHHLKEDFEIQHATLQVETDPESPCALAPDHVV